MQSDNADRRFMEALATVVRQYDPYKNRKAYDVRGTKANPEVASGLHGEPLPMPLTGDFYD